MAGQPSKGTRVIALVGPAGAGKTSLAEAMLFAAGATDRLGSTANGSSIGDSSPEARQRGGSTELNLYNFQYLGDDFAILDVPGSVGFSADGAKALAIADVAIVVVDPDPARAPARRAGAARARRARHPAPHLRQPHRPGARPHPRPPVGAPADQRVAADRPPDSDLGRREDQRLRRPRARICVQISRRPGVRADRHPDRSPDREAEARTHMLEQLADHDDELLEQLLMDEAPAREKVLQDLARETGDNLGVSVLFGSAISSWGVRRLLKAMRHEAPASRGDRRAGSASPTPRSMSSRSSTARSAAWRWRACSVGASPKARTSRPPTAAMRASARCSRSRAKRRTRSAKHATATSSPSPRSTRSRPGNGSAPASCRRQSRSTIRRATARSRSSPPTARTTSSCRARSTAWARKMRR